MAQFVAIGKPVGRVEGEAKVTGTARYAADVVLPGMLWAKCLRSPLPHARIVRIDTSRAAALLSRQDGEARRGEGDRPRRPPLPQWRNRAKGAGREGWVGAYVFVSCRCGYVRGTDWADEHAGLCTLAEVTFATR